MSAGVVIAGGGLAAQRCAEALRARGYEGPVRMVCAEPVAPYDRPPLSKELLAGERDGAQVALRPAGWHDEQGVELLLGERAARLDGRRRRLALASGAELPYEHLLIATGAQARRLPGAERFANVHALRTLADAERLRAELRPGARLAIVGAGFIGQEVGATARALGIEVTLVEAAPAPLAGVLGAELGGWFADLHRAEGVDVRVGRQIAELRGGERVEELVLDDGGAVACDVLLAGVGVDPAAGWLAGSGLELDGVHVDAHGRTRIPGVYAAGDVACPPDPLTGAPARTGHWEAAARQGAAAAHAMLGLQPRPAPPASFWSDQYGVRIHHLGDGRGAERVAIDGDPAARDFAATWWRDGRPVAALLVGRPRALASARRLLAGEGPRPTSPTTTTTTKETP